MKTILIALLMAFSIAFVGCKQQEPVVPDPEIVTFNVLPGTSFTTGDEITVNFEAKNAVSTENNIGAPTTTSWSYTLTATLNITNIKVSAINKNGVKVTKSKNITIVVPHIPDRTDSLCSMNWYLKAMECFNKEGVLLWHSILTESDTTKAYRFYASGRCTTTPKGGTESAGVTWKWVDSNHFMQGDQVVRYILDGNKFYWFDTNRDGSEIYRDTFEGVKL